MFRIHSPTIELVPKVDVKIIDGSALVHILHPKKSQCSVKTFKDYANHVFLPYIQRTLHDVVRLDVVWDVYINDSLKAQTREKRGHGSRIKLESDTIIPSNWNMFLCCDKNKDNLYKLLASAIQELQPPSPKIVIATKGQNAVSTPISDMSDLTCSHEEADTRLFFMSFMHTSKDIQNL